MSYWPGNARKERTPFGGLSRGTLMSRVRSFGNVTTEKRLASLLRREGLNGWRRHPEIKGRPDFVWSRTRVAVFVDGCFWHGHNCGKNVTPRTNARLWREKIARTKLRDRLTTRELRRNGWVVLRFWECELAITPRRCTTRIRLAVEERSGISA